MKRREFIGLIGGMTAWPRTVWGQQAASLPLVAVLAMATEQIANARSANIREGLKRAGLVEDKDYIITVRFAEGDSVRLQEIVRELDRLKPRVYVTVANSPQPIHRLAPNVPVVFTAIAIDPVAYGWVKSYAKPGGMTTGNVQNALGGLESLTSKQFQLFKELVPNLMRLGFIGLMDTAVQFPVEHAAVQKAAQQLGFAVSMYDVPTLDDVESAIESGQRDEVSAFFVSISPRLVARIPQIVATLAKTGKPALGPTAVWARGGLLMSYSTDFDEQARRAGGQVAQILSQLRIASAMGQQRRFRP
ncbi:ABC transporter substrate-binding protein [Bradyrhizobium manausense]|uniref:ABC transporter substrate-binding protein n=1 Tax=Bradyrhizobium manausense TaxID=989370 RepID=UPI001BAD9F38|nr:ABC transporter substrate-binding protein [Bradyrhizobium manausense]MBR1092677.1 ABC transporter substrate-binding protein [Bradyrhizobium manausense]